MKSLIKKHFVENYLNLRSFSSKRNIIVFQSDDWGSERMPDLATYEKLCSKNHAISEDVYCRFDSLAKVDDLSAMFETLLKFRDKNNQPPIFTFNVISGNPNYGLIKEHNFSQYFSEPAFETILKKNEGKQILELWKEGIEQGLIDTQFHGREHVHTQQWLNELREGNEQLVDAFGYGVSGIPYNSSGVFKRSNLQATLDFYQNKSIEVQEHKASLEQGVAFFNSWFNRFPESFIAPVYIWHPLHEKTLHSLGVKGIQGIPVQKIPKLSGYSIRINFTGKKSNNLYHTIRNAFFEPTITGNLSASIGECLKRIDQRFAIGQPVIIGSHRLNFIGSLDENNRRQNLNGLETLLQTILKKWPNTEFLSTNSLISLISNT